MADIFPDIDFANVTSPISPLGKWIKAAPYIVAPEFENEIVELQKAHNIHIRLDAKDNTFCIFAGKDERMAYVRIGLAVLERLWAYCYGFTKIVEIVKAEPPGTLVELKDKPEAQ